MSRRRSRRPFTWQRFLALAIVLLVIAVSERFAGRESGPAGESPSPGQPRAPAAGQATKTGFQVLRDCRVVDNRGNDGDSFRMEWQGQEYVFRLYFVDCPETSDRYPDRLRYQSEYFGGLDEQEVMAVGREARRFSLALLEDQPFEVLTRWEAVMDSERFHAFVRFPGKSPGQQWLSEQLVAAGLARIYTLPVDLPDGTSKEAFRAHLKRLESDARNAGLGAWGWK